MGNLKPDFDSNGASRRFPGALDCDSAIRSIITDAIKRSPKKRDQVALEMSEALGREVTVRMLNAFTSESSEMHRFPLAFLPALCQATGDGRLLHFIAEKMGLLVIDRWQAPVLKLGEKMVCTRMSQRDVEQCVEELVAARAHA